MNANLQPVPSLDALLADPAKVAMLSPQTAQTLLIGLASLQPVLIQRALMGGTNGHVENDLLTIPEAAGRLRLSEYRVYELIRQGELKETRLGRRVLVHTSDLAVYIARCRA